MDALDKTPTTKENPKQLCREFNADDKCFCPKCHLSMNSPAVVEPILVPPVPKVGLVGKEATGQEGLEALVLNQMQWEERAPVQM